MSETTGGGENSVTSSAGKSLTDSYGSKSDTSGSASRSGANNPTSSYKPKMEVVCMFDLHNPKNLGERKKAHAEVRSACKESVNANFHPIHVILHAFPTSLNNFELIYLL